jgi:putative endonuclease
LVKRGQRRPADSIQGVPAFAGMTVVGKNAKPSWSSYGISAIPTARHFRRDDESGWNTAMREEKVPAVYILASKRHGTLYIGVTSDLCSRVAAHKQGSIPGFTQKYDVKMLVWYEFAGSMEDTIGREKQLKEWRRGWKIELIEKLNPPWRDLFEEMCGAWID